MPGASTPWADSWAPAQWVGQLPAPPAPEAIVNNAKQAYDTTLHWKLAGTIIGALVMVFVLQSLGFRFVITAGVGR